MITIEIMEERKGKKKCGGGLIFSTIQPPNDIFFLLVFSTAQNIKL
jgi:hypothetical protein